MSLKVDINLLNQHCKSANCLADWLNDWLSHLGTQGTQSTWALKYLRHSKGIWALEALGHLGTWGIWAFEGRLGHLGTQDTWALGHWGTWSTRALEEQLDTQTLKVLGHSVTRRALRYLGIQALGHLRHSRHFILHTHLSKRPLSMCTFSLTPWLYNTKQDFRVSSLENLLKLASLWSHPHLGNLN